MKRIILFLLSGGLLIALGLSVARPQPPQSVRPDEYPKLVVPDEREVITTLPPLVITVPRPRPPRVPPRVTLTAAIIPPDGPALLCGAWRPLATDETQTVRYCEPRPPLSLLR